MCLILNCSQFNYAQCNIIDEKNIIEENKIVSEEIITQEQNENSNIKGQNIDIQNDGQRVNKKVNQDKEGDTQNNLAQKETKIEPKLLKANQITPFNSTRGFFLIHIKGEGKETISRINVNLTSTNRSKSQTIYFAEADTNGYTDNYNFQIITTSAKTKATEQNSYALFSFQFSYTKPAHLKASHWYSEKTGNERFNFNKSPTDTTTTMNNTGHNAYDTAEVINMQINLANCGIAALEVTPTNATGHIELKRDYYSGLSIDPNGGVHDGKNYKYNYGVKCCCTEVKINNPTRNGYAFIGWTFSKGANSGGATFNKNTSKFKYCGNSTSSSNTGNENICTLKAEWIKNNDKYVLPQTGAKLDMGILFSWFRRIRNNVFGNKKCKKTTMNLHYIKY